MVKGRERSVRTHGVEFKIRRKSGLPNLVDSFNLSLSLGRVSQEKRDVIKFEYVSNTQAIDHLLTHCAKNVAKFHF